MTVRIGIQRRSTCLVPPSSADLDWIRAALDEEEVYRAFGYAGPAGRELLARRAQLLVYVIRRAVDRRRVGFVLGLPPTPELPVLELAYAIPRRADRDAFTAIATADAISHYVFDHLGLEEVGWRTRASNLAAQAILQRLGYPEGEMVRLHGERYRLQRVDRASWAARRGKLEAGERRHPSGLGAAFVTLTGPAFVPRVRSEPVP